MNSARIGWLCWFVASWRRRTGQTAPVPQGPQRVMTRTRWVAGFSDLETHWARAVQHRDAGTLNRLLSEDFQVWTPQVAGPVPRGNWQRPAFGLELQSFPLRQMAVRSLNEQTAVASFVLTESVQSRGQGAGAKLRGRYLGKEWRPLGVHRPLRFAGSKHQRAGGGCGLEAEQAVEFRTRPQRLMGNLGESEVARRPLLTPTAVAHLAFVLTGIVNVLLGPVLPTLSTRWALNDTQAGELFTAQFLASTGGVALSGILVPRFGYQAVLVLGLVFMAIGVATLPLGSWLLGLASVACFGAGLGLTIPTANLLVAEVNPAKKASALTLLNFSWSVGAVACPFLLAAFQRSGPIATFFYAVGVCLLLAAAALAGVSLPHPNKTEGQSATPTQSLANLLRTPAAIALGTLFFVYVGTENAVGGWLASYAKRIGDGAGTMWVTTPSFFYGALLLGRAVAPLVLRRVPELTLARSGVATAWLGVLGLIASPSMPAVLASAVVIGLGLSAVYPITIALLSHNFGAAATRLGGVMFALAGLGAACMPWIVGFTSTQLSSLKFGLTVPLAGSVIMLALYARNWAGPTVP
jgi:MFS transporter, FHS family, glucose/mannose:H+ symporter